MLNRELDSSIPDSGRPLTALCMSMLARNTFEDVDGSCPIRTVREPVRTESLETLEGLAPEALCMSPLARTAIRRASSHTMPLRGWTVVALTAQCVSPLARNAFVDVDGSCPIHTLREPTGTESLGDN